MQQPELDNLPEDPREDELDFSDLDEIIAEVEAKRTANKALAGKHKRLAKGGLSEDERMALLAEIRHFEDSYIWQTTAAVALFHTQHCLSCSHQHRFFMGWMTQQDHKRDPNCRRLVRGKPVDDSLPQRVEEHAQGNVEMCDDCAEACLVINRFIQD